MTDLHLPKTHLTVRDGVLRKITGKDETVAEFALKDIRDVRLERCAEWPFPLVLAGVFGGLAWVSSTYIPSDGWAWAATILCCGIAAFVLLTIVGRKVVIVTDGGTVGYLVNDTVEEAEGFVITLRHALRQ